MARQCTVCKNQYPSHANFCALCGRPLVTVAVTRAGRHAGLVVVVIVAGLATYAVLAATRSAAVLENRRFDIPRAKATAMFELLRPRDVKVVVRRDGGRLKITGTPQECDALAKFVGLITRYTGKPECEVRVAMERARKGWSTRQRYKLPKSKARALFNALAPDDVPVLVSWSGKRVRVDASPQVQETIRQVVEILRGRRLKKG